MGEKASGLLVRDLRAWHPGQAPVVDGVDFRARRGEVTSILGPNGAGKSTLLKAVLNLLPWSGEVRLDGLSLAELSVNERARKIAYVPQRGGLQAGLCVRAVVEQGRFAHRGALGRIGRADQEIVNRALVETEVAALADRSFSTLSGGERQRVLIARALATGARTLLLDEPTSSLDVRQVLRVHQVLRNLADEGLAILVVLHDLSEARSHCDRALLLCDSTPHGEGLIAERITSTSIREVYGVDLVEGGGLGYELVGR